MQPTPNKFLNPEKAYQIVERLVMLPGFPGHPNALAIVAEDLMSLCHGQDLAGEYWDAERQAEWLTQQIYWSWERWRGPAAMRELFYSHFSAEVDPHTPPAKIERPTIQCPKCKDTGTVRNDAGEYAWCDCAQGRLMQSECPRWLELLNRKPTPPLPAPAPAPGLSASPALITQADIDRAIAVREARKKRKQEQANASSTSESSQHQALYGGGIQGPRGQTGPRPPDVLRDPAPHQRNGSRRSTVAGRSAKLGRAHPVGHAGPAKPSRPQEPGRKNRAAAKPRRPPHATRISHAG